VLNAQQVKIINKKTFPLVEGLFNDEKLFTLADQKMIN
jgi:hypothetical protein